MSPGERSDRAPDLTLSGFLTSFFLICEFWTASVANSVDFLVLIYNYLYADHVTRLWMLVDIV